MDMLSECLPSKIEHISSSLYSSALLWTSKIQPLSSIRKIPRKQHLAPNYKFDLFQPGLKTLAAIHHHNSEQEKLPPRVVHCYTAIPSTMSEPYSAAAPPLLPPLPSMWLSSSYACKCTVIGDVLGAESGDYMMMDQAMVMKTEQPPPLEEEQVSMMVQRKLLMRKEKEKINRENIPPPITVHWGLKRECGDDGRLIIRAERVRRLHEQVESHRQDGRLTMNLVPDDEYCEECGYPMESESELELEDLEFNEEPEGLECEKEELEEEEKEGQRSKLCWDLRDDECVGVAYGGGPGSFWAGNALADPNRFMGLPASPSAPLRPITSVM